MDAGAAAGALPPFWQVLAALVAVLGLLVLALKLLHRLQASGSGADVALLRVRKLGPKRELEVLRVDDEVFTVYRHDGGLVLLRREARAAHERRAADAAADRPARSLGRRLLALAAAGGRADDGPSA